MPVLLASALVAGLVAPLASDAPGDAALPETGAHLRLSVPGVCRVALHAGSSQRIVDARDSAAFFRYGNCVVVADHSTQAFRKLKRVKRGKAAVIRIGKRKVRLVCTRTRRARISATADLSAALRASTREKVVMYTCEPSWPHVRLTLWKVSKSGWKALRRASG